MMIAFVSTLLETSMYAATESFVLDVVPTLIGVYVLAPVLE